MPSPLLETAAVLQSAAGRVETLDLAGTQRVGSVDPGDTGFGKKLSVIVGVEIVDIDFEAVYIDKVLGTELGPFEQLAEIGQVRAVELVQKEISIGNILMVLDLQGVDRGPALEALAVALALLMTCDGSKSERSEMTFGADAEETLVLLPKTDKTRIGQLQGGITALDLLEYRIVFAIVVELDLIGQLVAQIRAESRADTFGILVDPHIDQLADLALYSELRLLVYGQRGKFRRPPDRSLHLAIGPLALAGNNDRARTIEAEAGSLLADKTLQWLRRRKGHGPLETATLTAALLQRGAAEIAAYQLAPNLPLLTPVFEIQVIVHLHGDRRPLRKPADAAAVVDHT